MIHLFDSTKSVLYKVLHFYCTFLLSTNHTFVQYIGRLFERLTPNLRTIILIHSFVSKVIIASIPYLVWIATYLISIRFFCAIDITQ